MIDSHAHLTSKEFAPHSKPLLMEFYEKGGLAVLNVGFSPLSNLDIIAFKEANSLPVKIYSAIGLHPELFSPVSQDDELFITFDSAQKALSGYEKLLAESIDQIDCMGECGLDYYRLYESNELTMSQKEESREIQKIVFRKHVELARKYKKPLTIHVREGKESTQCIEDAIQIAGEVGGGLVKGSFHSYTGAAKYIDEIIGLGFGIGFNAILTYKSADDVRKLVAMVPNDKILLESDTPFLPTAQNRADKKKAYRLGHPADIFEVAEIVSALKGVPTKKLLEMGSENFRALFDI